MMFVRCMSVPANPQSHVPDCVTRQEARGVWHTSESRGELPARMLQRLSPCLGFRVDTGLESGDIWLPGQPRETACSPAAVGPYCVAALAAALLHCQAGDVAALEPCGSCSLGP